MRGDLDELALLLGLDADELSPPPSPELDSLPLQVRVQCRLFDALVLLTAVRKELAEEDGRPLLWAAGEIEDLCHDLDQLLEWFAC